MENKIDVAVLGLGGMGGTHVGAAKASPYVRNIYGYEPDQARAALRGRELGISATSDLASIMNNPEIKLVYIASINEVHTGQTEMAMRAGKAVLCEKPMGIDLSDARRMLAVEKETGGFLQIGFELHYSKMYMTVKDWIERGLIGTPVNTQCRYYCSEFHLKDTWRSKSKGTLIGEKLSHYLDLQRWWINSPVDEVFSMNAPNVVNYFNHPDNHQINLRFKNGAVSSLNFVMYIAETDDGHYLQYHIFGTKGAIETDVFRRRIRRWEFSDSPKQLVSKIAEKISFPKEEDQTWFHNTHGQNLRIAELVAQGPPPTVPGRLHSSSGICTSMPWRKRPTAGVNSGGWARPAWVCISRTCLCARSRA